MFPKKKPVPTSHVANAGSTPSPSRENGPSGYAGHNYTQSPMSTPGYPFGVPTLHPSPADGSSSTPVPQRNSGHARSASHPFPALFGGLGGKKDGHKVGRESPAEGNTRRKNNGSSGLLSSSFPKANAKPQQGPDGDLMTGSCATCDATVRWPRHVDVFRCTVCHMVNDLQYGSARDFPVPGSAGRSNNGGRPPRRGNTQQRRERDTC